VLAANGEIDPLRIEGIGLAAELALGGELRACGAGTMLADAAAAAGLAGLVLAEEDREPALLAGALPVAGARTLTELVRLLRTPARSNDRGPRRPRRELSSASRAPRGARRPG
jgi:predicted ATPase with chaperone activity